MDLRLEDFCQLIAADHTHPPIELEDGKPLLIGRGPLTLITDRKVSRNHVELTANFAAKELIVKQVGANPSRVAGKILTKDQSSILGQMGKFELVPDMYKYHIHFGQRAPESVLNDLKKEADYCSSSNDDAVVDQELNSTEPEVHRKRERDFSDSEDCFEDGEEMFVKNSSKKRAKLDISNPVPGSTVTSKPQQMSLTSFIKQRSSDSSDTNTKLLEPQVEEKGSLLIMRFGDPVTSHKIACYDLDGTLIETASGRKFAKDSKDWKLMPKVVDKLQSLHRDGYKITIFSNQLGISKGKQPVGEFKVKAKAVARALDVPLLLLAATSKDKYRKPCVSMWEYMIKFENGGVAADPKESFYVGDAAGREANWKPGAKKDFSCTDRKFAANLSLPFMTPEEHFHKFQNCSKFSWGEFDPRTLDYTQTCPSTSPSDAKLYSDSQEVVVFVGCPASGKSTFYAKFMKPKGYIQVNRDTLGSWQKCVAECAKLLSTGKSVVIDNTSPDKDSRLRYIDVAHKHKVPVRSFQFMTSIAHAKHNNRFRELTAKSSKYVKVNDIAFNTYKSKFCEPELGEGFTEIVKIHFIPTFDNDHHAGLYKDFLD